MSDLPQSAPALPGAHDLFEPAAFLPRLDHYLSDSTDAKDIRARTVVYLAEAREAAMADIIAGFETHPRAARETVRAIAAITDGLVTAIHHVAITHLHPPQSITTSGRLSMLAIGGYGRAEMAPQSDVDLLFLTPYKPTGLQVSMIESMLYMLWDLKLKIGHSVRTVEECLRLGREDMTIRTSLLESRPVTGDAALSEELRERLRHELFALTIPEFVEAKMDERDARHLRQGERYMLEPNVKEGKGGLRDLQTLYWIAKYVHGVDRAVELVDLGFFTRDEHRAFWQAEDFLWAVRCHLHLITGRPAEKLTFESQVDVAKRMGYLDGQSRRAVEYFMQDYFRHATRVGDVTRVFLSQLEARHVRKPPILERLLVRRRRLSPPFYHQMGRLGIADEGAFLADPLNLLRLFDVALRTSLLIHPDAMRVVAANLDLIDDKVQRSPVGAKIFRDLLIRHGNPEAVLRRMNELGVLAAYIPEFEPIVAMMQFNVYHHYTVDEHLIQCVATLSEIERGELAEELPICTRIMRGGINRQTLYLAVLLHDIGKGRPEDHSILGARISRRVSQRLGLSPTAVEDIEWLVRNHLLMSDVAQKRDITDPRTLRDFAKAVKTRRRLDMLTVLTVCDIRGVGPGTWNNWKGTLFRALYTETTAALEGGVEQLNRERRSSEAKGELRRALTADGWERRDIRAETGRHYASYWSGLSTDTQVVFARLLRDLGPQEIGVDLFPDPDHDATRGAFVLANHHGLFARLAGALALVGANIVDARTFTTKDGFATAAFWFQDSAGHPYAPERLPRLRKMIDRTLKGEVLPHDELADRERATGKKRRAFRFPTHITFDNEGSDIYTIIEVDTRDRPGLLFDLTQQLAKRNIQISSAMIATFGAQVVDTFYVKDMFGMKLYDEDKQVALERCLREAVVAPA